MNKKDMEKIIEVAESCGWGVNTYEDDFTFSKYSPCGQDFNIEVSANDLEDLIGIIQSRCEDFDCSYETYIWLDNTGHGTNGAPYDMKDLYEDMESI